MVLERDVLSRVDDSIDQMKLGSKRAQKHHVANYVLGGLAIIVSIVCTLVAAGVIQF